MKNKLYIASDHAGFYLKEELKEKLSKDYDIEDLSRIYREGDDYPEYAFKVGEKVVKNKSSMGILVCGTGTGMNIAANKVKGVRAVEAYDDYSAKMSRIDNDTNILTLRAREFPIDKSVKIAKLWLKTPFSAEERHDRRIRKILLYEHRKK